MTRMGHLRQQLRTLAVFIFYQRLMTWLGWMCLVVKSHVLVCLITMLHSYLMLAVAVMSPFVGVVTAKTWIVMTMLTLLLTVRRSWNCCRQCTVQLVLMSTVSLLLTFMPPTVYHKRSCCHLFVAQIPTVTVCDSSQTFVPPTANHRGNSCHLCQCRR